MWIIDSKNVLAFFPPRWRFWAKSQHWGRRWRLAFLGIYQIIMGKNSIIRLIMRVRYLKCLKTPTSVKKRQRLIFSQISANANCQRRFSLKA
jgi:hypothetical protein